MGKVGRSDFASASDGEVGHFQMHVQIAAVRTATIIWCAVFLLLGSTLAACVDLTVYGPYDDFSGLTDDFVSESVRKNLRVGQPFGDKGMAEDAYRRFAALGFEVAVIRRDLEAADATCSQDTETLQCSITRKWTVVWPKPTRDLNGQLLIDRIQPIGATISYYVSTTRTAPHVRVTVRYEQ